MTLENLKQYRPGVMLADDESNAVHRIRAGREVHEWLRGMTAEERGAVLTEAYTRARAGAAGVEAGSEAGPAGVEPAAVKVDTSTLLKSEVAALEYLNAGAVLQRAGPGWMLVKGGERITSVTSRTLARMVEKGVLVAPLAL